MTLLMRNLRKLFAKPLRYSPNAQQNQSQYKDLMIKLPDQSHMLFILYYLEAIILQV